MNSEVYNNNRYGGQSQDLSSSSSHPISGLPSRSKATQKSPRMHPYHITHGATAYQQISRRTESNPRLFSSTGFDIVSILARVASRPNPTVFIGPVDFSCAFLVSDALDPECPILYASPSLAKLTGYEVHDFLGHSCRFLQWPKGRDGPPESHPSNQQARAEIKLAIATDSECQTSLINYRKNGELFINFVTIIPISWDTPRTRYWVGFQVDISQPAGFYNGVSLAKPPSAYIPINATIPISEKLRTLVEAEASSTESSQEKVFDLVAQNLDDFILAVSPDGIVFHITGRIHETTGWTADELQDQSITTFLHPDDSPRIIDELSSFRTISPPPRSASSVDIAAHYTHLNRIVSLLFRVFRKQSDKTTSTLTPNNVFAWVEATGRINIDSPGKTFLILAARIVHLPRVSLAQIDAAGELGSNTLSCWTRVSLDNGLILAVASGSEQLLGCSSGRVVGTRVVDWVTQDFKEGVDGLFGDISNGIVKPFSNWTKPRQITALMVDEGGGDAFQNLKGMAGLEGPLELGGLGRPIVVTLFPPDLLSTPSPAVVPVFTSVPASESTEEGGNRTSTVPAPGTSASNLSTTQEPMTSPFSANPSASLRASLPTTVICRFSLPLLTPPPGMLSATGVAQTNQAYLFDPFGATAPASGSNSASSSSTTIASTSSNGTNTSFVLGRSGPTSSNGSGSKPRTPPLTIDRPPKLKYLAPPPFRNAQSHLSTQQYLHQGAIQHLQQQNPSQQAGGHSLDRLMASEQDIYSVLSPNSSTAAVFGGAEANMTWEDQIDRLRSENARMKAEIDTLLAHGAKDSRPVERNNRDGPAPG